MVDQSGLLRQITDPYRQGTESSIPANEILARSAMFGGSSKYNSKSGVSPLFPIYNIESCVACGNCYTVCPDTAFYPIVVKKPNLEEAINKVGLGEEQASAVRGSFKKITEVQGFKKYVQAAETAGLNPEEYYATIAIDYKACKGCGECVDVCKPKSLSMVYKDKKLEELATNLMEVYQKLPPIDKAFTSNDIMLDSKNYVMSGGHGACMGCGETTALRMMSTATYQDHGSFVIVSATGCNSIYSATWPWASFKVPWFNSLFENPPAVAMGIRAGLDQRKDSQRKVWAVMGDGAAYDIGFQSLSRMLASGLDIKVLVLDTGAYSNTGGQTSTATFMGAEAKMSSHGTKIFGKQESRKNLINIVMAHGDVFAAQVSTSYRRHFFKAIQDANSFPGPSVVIAYTPCQPEHGIGDDQSFNRAKAAVLSRASPLVIYDPRKGDTIHERISLEGNPSPKEDWHFSKEGGFEEKYDFLWFAKEEVRFAKHFRGEQPTQTISNSQEDVLKQWRKLQEMARLI